MYPLLSIALLYSSGVMFAPLFLVAVYLRWECLFSIGVVLLLYE